VGQGGGGALFLGVPVWIYSDVLYLLAFLGGIQRIVGLGSEKKRGC